MSKKKPKLLLEIKDADKDTFKFLDLGDYQIKLVSVNNARQFIIMSLWDVRFAQLDEIVKF